MRSRIAAAMAAAAVAIGSLAASSPPPRAPQLTYTIAHARTLAVGRTVTVEGIVTVPSGVIDAGFAIQDASGGIYVADSTGHWRTGRRMRVTGRLTSNHGLLTLAPASVRRIGQGRMPRPRGVRTSTIGERTEGRLVTVRGAAVDSVQDDAPYGHKLWIDDGSGRVQVFFPAGAGAFDFAAIRRGTRVTVTGLSAQYDQAYEVMPRWRADLVVSGGR